MQLLLHRQRRMKCALRMVLMGHRRAEQCEDAVARRVGRSLAPPQRDVALAENYKRSELIPSIKAVSPNFSPRRECRGVPKFIYVDCGYGRQSRENVASQRGQNWR